MRNKQIAKQAKMKERRKRSKEKKAIAMANANDANAKKATKTVGLEPKPGENHVSKRSKVASKDPPGGAKNVHQTTVQVQAKGKRILTDAGRKNRGETTKTPVSEKSKRGRRMGEQTTPAH